MQTWLQSDNPNVTSLWRHQVETFSALLAFCAGNSPVIGEFPSQRPVTRSFDVFLICAWTNGWINNRYAGDLRRHRAHYDVTVMLYIFSRHLTTRMAFLTLNFPLLHDDVIKWKHFPRYWPFVRRIHRSPVNSPHKGQWRGALMCPLICVCINDWVNNGEAGDLRRYRIHYDVIVMHWGPMALELHCSCNVAIFRFIFSRNTKLLMCL